MDPPARSRSRDFRTPEQATRRTVASLEQGASDLNNNIRNQFEVPVLFYMLALMLWQLADARLLTLTLAWLFVASRIVHAWIHTHSNYVPARRRVFTLGVAVVLAMAAVALRRLA